MQAVKTPFDPEFGGEIEAKRGLRPPCDTAFSEGFIANHLRLTIFERAPEVRALPSLYPTHAVLGSGGEVARVVFAACYPRATALTLLSSRAEPIRREHRLPSVPQFSLESTSGGHVHRRNGRNRCPVGETAPLSASTGTHDGVAVAPVFACTINSAWHGARQKGECIMHEQRRWFVGVDWASQEHVVSLCDGQGKKIGQRKFAHGGTGLSDMIA